MREERIDPVKALRQIVENLQKQIPQGSVVKICIGAHASWAEVTVEDTTREFANPALRIDQNVNDAICVALGWAPPTRAEETIEQKLAKLPPELRLHFLLTDQEEDAPW